MYLLKFCVFICGGLYVFVEVLCIFMGVFCEYVKF